MLCTLEDETLFTAEIMGHLNIKSRGAFNIRPEHERRNAYA